MASEPQNDCNMDVGETSEEEFSEGSDIDLDSEDSDSTDDTHDVTMTASLAIPALITSCTKFSLSSTISLECSNITFTLVKEYPLMKTVATGTVRGNRKGLPKQCIKSKLRDQEVSERRKGPLLCVSYKDKNRQPHLLSTVARAGKTQVTTRRNVVKEKPNVVNIYNKVMVGVDLKDTKLYVYLSERRTMKWSTTFVFAVLGTSVLNAYIVYKANTNAQRPLRRHDSLISLVHALVGDFRPFRGEKRRSQEEIRAARARQDILPPTHDIAQKVRVNNIIKLPGQTRRQCVGDHATRVRSRVKCSTCNVVVCPICVGKYHS
ncbi:hypothetical protein Pcinc_034266 [Petrolisthes cinctipes]|uniref:PiggyBac transposable element-derived protein domain-containing protein n=1 Tax=Petrolisthes cinctipes TaxID=88211 RepID=A0AAE1EQL0_PETCI|nr:hypothetical protein Pcinc_034266 [Petrolisthes cinctipes]